MLALTRALGSLGLSPAPAAALRPAALGLLNCNPAVPAAASAAPQAHPTQRRFAGEIVNPRKVRFRKAHKGRIPLPLGGSVSGTTLQHGVYGLALREGARLSAAQLESARRLIRRKIRAVKGCEMWLRVFPDVPVSSKGNETRMGKGKGTLDHYMCRVPMGRVVFEIGGGDLRWEVAHDALRQAGIRLPAPTVIVTRKDQDKLAREWGKEAAQLVQAEKAALKVAAPAAPAAPSSSA